MDINDKKTQFSLIYTKEVDLVFRYIFLRVASREDAIDIVQEAFAKFWQVFSAGEQVRHPRAFILTIVRNKIIDWYRKRRPLSLQAMTEEDNLFDIADGKAQETIVLSAEARLAMGAIGKLSPQDREVVYLRFVEGLSPAEIAEILSVTANAVSIRLNRGLEELRERLGIKLE